MSPRTETQSPITAVLPATMRPRLYDDNQRFGSADDGGYIIPECAISQSDIIVSMGINLDWSFEKAIAKQYPEKKLICFDRTTTFWYALSWGISRFLYSPVSRRPHHFSAIKKPFGYLGYINSSQITHHQKFIGTQASETTADICEVLDAIPANKKVFLKIDIEGAEYDVLDAALTRSERLTGIAAEYHDVGTDARCFPQIERLQNDFYISHLHVNNAGGVDENSIPPLLEATFINKSLTGKPPALFTGDIYRHSLDSRNVREKPDVAIGWTDRRVA